MAYQVSRSAMRAVVPPARRRMEGDLLLAASSWNPHGAAISMGTCRRIRGGDMRVCGMILDVDDTLVLSNDAHAQARVEAFAELSYEVPFGRVRLLLCSDVERTCVRRGRWAMPPRVSLRLTAQHTWPAPRG